MKDQFINGLEASLAQKQDQRPDEPEAEYKSRMVSTRLGKAAVSPLCAKERPSSSAWTWTAAGTSSRWSWWLPRARARPWWRTCATVSKQRSRFAWLGSGSPLAAWISLPVPKELRDVLAEFLEKSRKEREAKAKTDVEKALAGRFFELLKQNLTADEIDMGWAVQGPHKSPSGEVLFGLIGGMKVKDGKEVERLVRDAIAKQSAREGRQGHVRRRQGR